MRRGEARRGEERSDDVENKLFILTRHHFAPRFTTVDFVRPAHIYASEYNNKNSDLYGLGYTYSHWLNGNHDNVLRHSIGDRISNKEFDLVVFGSVHRGMPFWEEVKEVYRKEDVVFIDGEDEHECGKNYLRSEGFYFMREISQEMIDEEGCSIIYN